MALFRRGGIVPRRTLSAELGVTARTVADDLRALRACGAPLLVQRGRNGGIGLQQDFRLALATVPPRQQRQALGAALSGRGGGLFEPDSASEAAAAGGHTALAPPSITVWCDSRDAHTDLDALLVLIDRAIRHRRVVSFVEANRRRSVQPLQLRRHNGSYWLLADESGRRLAMPVLALHDHRIEPATFAPGKETAYEHDWSTLLRGRAEQTTVAYRYRPGNLRNIGGHPELAAAHQQARLNGPWYEATLTTKDLDGILVALAAVREAELLRPTQLAGTVVEWRARLARQSRF